MGVRKVAKALVVTMVTAAAVAMTAAGSPAAGGETFAALGRSYPAVARSVEAIGRDARDANVEVLASGAVSAMPASDVGYPDGAFAAEVLPTRVTTPGRRSAWMTFEYPSGRFRVRLVGAFDPSGSNARGNELRLVDVRPGVDAYYAVSDQGIEEFLHVERSNGSGSFTWEYDLPDGWSVGADGRGVQVFDSNGWIVLALRADWVQSASGRSLRPEVHLDADDGQVSIDVPDEFQAEEYVLDPHWAVATAFDDHAYQWKVCGSTGEDDPSCRSTGAMPPQWNADFAVGDSSKYSVDYTLDEALRIRALGSKSFADTSWAQWKYTPVMGTVVDQFAWNGRQTNVAGSPGASPFRCGLRAWQGGSPSESLESGGSFDLAGPRILLSDVTGSGQPFDSVAFAMVHDGSGSFTSGTTPLNACHVKRLDGDYEEQQLHLILIDEVTPSITGGPTVTSDAGDAIVGPNDLPRLRVQVAEEGSGIDLAHWSTDDGSAGPTSGSVDYCTEEVGNGTGDEARPCSLGVASDPDIVPTNAALVGSDGPRAVDVTVEDFASNFSSPATASMTWDATPPAAITGLTIDAAVQYSGTRYVTDPSAIGIAWFGGTDAHPWKQQYTIVTGACPTSTSQSGWTTAAGSATTSIASPTEHLTYRLCVRSVDAANNITIASIDFEVDQTAPVVPTVYDGPATGIDADWVSATSRLQANWTSSDTSTGVGDHEYCVSSGIGCTGTVFEPWASSGSGTDMTADGQPVAIGDAYVTCVRVTDNVGNRSDPVCSDGVQVALPEIPRDGTTATDAQYQDSKTELSINWDPLTSDTGSSFDWKLCSEVQCLVPIASGTTSATTVTVSGISPSLASGRYIGCVRATDPYAYTGGYLCSNGVRVDADAPAMGTPRDGAGSTDIDVIGIKTGGSVTALTANWDEAVDNVGGEGIDHYDWMFCTAATCSGPEVLATSPTTDTTVTASIAPQTSGALYACVRAVDGGGNQSTWQCSDGATIATAGGTNKSGTITSTHEVWTKAMSPINLTGNFTISTGSTLTIDPGVVVRAMGAHQIRTSNGGSLTASGTAAEPILFTRNEDQGSAFGGGSCAGCATTGNWNGFRLDTGANRIEHAVIRYAGITSSSLVTVGSIGATTTLALQDVRITNSPAKVQVQNGALLTIASSYIGGSGTLTATGSGSSLTATALTVANGATSLGTTITSSASADIDDSTLTGSGTNISVNGGAQVDLTGSTVSDSTGATSIGVDVSGSGTAIDMDDTTVTGNLTGVKVASGSSITINNSTLSVNGTGFIGDGSFAIVDSTVSSNTSNGISSGASAGMGAGMTGLVRNATIAHNGGSGVRGRVTSTGKYVIVGSTIHSNAVHGVYLLGNGTSVTGDPSVLIGNRITRNGYTGNSSYGIQIDGTFGVSGDNSRWPAGHRNVVIRNGNPNASYQGGGQISSTTMYPPSTSWAALPHWADNEWGVEPQQQPIGTRAVPLASDTTNTPCDNDWFYSGKRWQYPVQPWVKDTYPEVANSSWAYNIRSGVEIYCVQSNAKIPVSGPRSSTLKGTAGSSSDVVKNFRTGGNGINTATGNYTETRTDIANPSDLGIALEVARTYNSTSTASGVLGTGWSWNLGASLDVSDPAVAITALLEDGTGIEYYSLGGGSYGASADTRSTLEAVGSPVTGYVLTRRDQSALTFDTDGRLVSNHDRNGHGVELTYSGSSPRPSTATDEAGHTYTFSWDGNDKLEEIASSDGRTVGYDVVGEELRSVTDVRGKTWTYAYDGGLLQSLTSPEGRELFHNDYGSGRDVTSQLDANGRETTLDRDTATGESTTTDPAGRDTVDTYEDGRLTGTEDPLGRTVGFGYDNRSNANVITDTDGGVTKLTYDAHGNVTRRVAPAPFGYVERYSWDARNNMTEKVDARGNVTHYAYDGAGNLTHVKRQDGPAPGGIDHNVTEYVLNADQQVEQVIDARGKSTYRTYDPTTHYLVSESKELGAPTTWDHDAVGRVTTTVDPVGNAPGGTPADHATTNAYDEAGNLLSTENAYGDETHRAYDDDGRLEYEIDAAGERTDYEYDAAGRVTKVTEPAVGADPRRSTRKLYDKRGLLVKEVDQLGRVTTYTYDAAGQRTSMVAPKGNSGAVDPDRYRTRYVHDRAGRLTDTIDPLGNTTSTEYDALGRATRRSNARFRDTLYRYDANGNVVAITNAAGATATREYDALDRLVARSDFRGNVTRLEYNEVGLVTKERTPEQIAQTPDGATTYCYDDDQRRSAVIGPRAGDIACGTPNDYQTDYAYDEAGRLVSTTDPEGNVTATSWDRAGRRASQTDAEGHATQYRYDENGRLAQVEAPPHPTLGDRITSYAYDEVGNLISRTNANGDVTDYAYDAAHQLVGKELPNASRWAYGYDLNGNHTTTVDANGNATPGVPGDGTTEYVFDRADRIVGIDYSDATPDVTYDLTPTGQVAEATAGSTTEIYSYDALDQLTSVERGASAFAYGHDADGNVTSRTYPGQGAVAYAYDGDGRLEQVGSGGDATTYTYDDAGNRVTTTLPNGIVETRTYDHADRLTEIESVDGATPVEDVAYTLDGVGNPVVKTTTAGTETYGYDEMNQLVGVCFAVSCSDPEDPQITFGYDRVGKRLSTTAGDGMSVVTTFYCYAGDGSDQLLNTTTSGACLGTTPDRFYDANGNLVSDPGRSYVYDLANRLTSIDDGSTTTAYAYDAEGKRVISDDGTTTTEQYWDTTWEHAQLALATDGTTTRSYRYGHGRISTTDGIQEQYFLADRIGSVLHVTDANADVDWSYQYDPFGNVTSSAQVDPNASANDMQYAGEQLDPTGLTHLRARQYDPSTGRFTSIDPMEVRNELDTEDPYVASYIYAGNRPTAATDPSGEIMLPTPEAAATAMAMVSAAAVIAQRCSVFVVAGATTIAPALAGLACMAPAMALIWRAYDVMASNTQDYSFGGSSSGAGAGAGPTINNATDGGDDHSGSTGNSGGSGGGTYTNESGERVVPLPGGGGVIGETEYSDHALEEMDDEHPPISGEDVDKATQGKPLRNSHDPQNRENFYDPETGVHVVREKGTDRIITVFR